MLLGAQNIACHRGVRLLIEDFSCQLQAGQAIWLTGPNGVGKSTLLQVLAGVRRPLRGSVTQKCESVYLPSAPGFDAALTLQQNLDWWCAVHSASAISIINALSAWELTPQAKLPYASLSQGQQQRAALARLSLSTAPLWFLDEPLAHLDAAGQTLFARAATAHLERGGSMIAATHATATLPQAIVLELCAA